MNIFYVGVTAFAQRPQPASTMTLEEVDMALQNLSRFPQEEADDIFIFYVRDHKTG